ncbi:Probable ABC transporter permease protein HI_1471 [Actinomyces bovis]|uniref:Probable ABC transporter permease protein HI_1471 n=1 Tax=Actinomyces bovis TaxID=1658 RepID=A0ABY1VQC2_9ACTO|nr:iron chelate uptake ABC transporter family permease subunit [Actinomyces bovis]SPT53947.1 Probable ABC transporter permease protein HI_1471 [Actinomyces bovis]VEG53461.1 Probable ABC transporter permease protein HI_1471 [Actinomyces israelii]
MTPYTALTTCLAARRRGVRARTAVLAIAALACCLAFLLWDAFPGWQIIVGLRVRRFLAIVVVAVALSTSTVVFQSVTRNRILSPGVMGFDALYRLIATTSVFLMGSGAFAGLHPVAVFALNAGIMTGFAALLLAGFLSDGRRSIHLLVLVGIVLGTLFRSLSVMLSFIMDPNELLTVQDKGTASFSVVNEESLWVCGAVCAVVTLIMSLRAHRLDVLALGPDLARGLGVHHQRESRIALGLSCMQVACATALVGPLMFLGLLVVNIGVYALRSTRTRDLLLGCSLLAVVVLVGGQGLLEHLFNQSTVLPVVIEFTGGLLLATMIFKEARR